MTGLREVCLTVMVMVMLVHGAPSQPVGEKGTPTDNVAYYPYVRLPVDAENDPKLKDVIPGPIPMSIIDAPLICPQGQQLDHTGQCRDIWRSIRFSNLLNLEIN